MSLIVISAHLRDTTRVHREEPPALTVSIEPEFDRELHLAVQGLQPGDLILVTGNYGSGIGERPMGPFCLDKQDLPVLPGNQVHRGTRPGASDYTKSAIP
jgi:hypothetical protein